MLSFCPTLKKAFYRFLGESSPVQSSPVQSTSPVNKDAPCNGVVKWVIYHPASTFTFLGQHFPINVGHVIATGINYVAA